jgi:hypothetical protein
MNDKKSILKFTLEPLHKIEDIFDDNIDVLVRLDNNETYSVTFFTIKNVMSLMDKWKTSGENLNGTYLWPVDGIIVETLDLPHMESVIADLLYWSTEQFRRSFTRCPPREFNG